MRELWTEHAFWTEKYIVSYIAGLEDQKPVLARLLKNQDDLGNAIKPYYGEEAGNKLAQLLRGHILTCRQSSGCSEKRKSGRLKKIQC